MPLLDYCISSVYEPGNIGAGAGYPPVIIHGTTLYTPESYDPDAVTYSLDFSKFYNSSYLGVI